MSNLYDLMAKLKAIEESATAESHGKHHNRQEDDSAYEKVIEYTKHYMFANQIDALGSEDVDSIATELGLPMDEVIEYLYDVGLAPDIDDDDEYDMGGEEGQRKQRYEPLPHPGDHVDETSVDECPQDGNVQLSMQDLVKLVKALQGGGEPQGMPGDQPLMGDDEFDEEYGNTPNPQVGSVDCVTPTGDDMFSKGDEAEKVNGGGNPLQAHLAELYAQIKEAPRRSDIPAVQRKAQAQKQGYKDTWKVSKKELDAEDRDNISHRDSLAKARGSLKEANEMARKLRKA